MDGLLSSFMLPNGSAAVKYKFNHLKYEENKYMFNNSVIIKQNYDILDKYIFNEFGSVNPSRVYKEYEDEYINAFLRKSLQQYILCGFCAYKINKVKLPVTKDEVGAPVICNLEYLDIELIFDPKKMTYVFEVHDYNTNRLRKDIHISCFASIENLANEYLIYSPLTFIQENFYVNRQRQYIQMQGEYNAANPVVYLEQEKEVDKKSVLQHSIGRSTMMDNTISPLDALNRSDVFDDEPMKRRQDALIQDQDFHSSQIDYIIQQYDRNKMNSDRLFFPHWYNNMFKPPPGMKIAFPIQKPQVNYDYIQQMTYLASLIYIAFGIPESLFGVHHIGNASNIRTTSKPISIVDISTFETTMEKYKCFYEKLYKEVYILVFGKEPKFKIKFAIPQTFQKFRDHLLDTTKSLAEMGNTASNDKKSKSADKPAPKPKADTTKKSESKPKEDDKKSDSKPKDKPKNDDKKSKDDDKKSKEETKSKPKEDDQDNPKEDDKDGDKDKSKDKQKPKKKKTKAKLDSDDSDSDSDEDDKKSKSKPKEDDKDKPKDNKDDDKNKSKDKDDDKDKDKDDKKSTKAKADSNDSGSDSEDDDNKKKKRKKKQTKTSSKKQKS